MIGVFLRYVGYKKSWIFLFLVLLGLTDVLILLDHGIAVHASSMIYLNVLFLFVVAVFLVWRYKTETKYAAALAARSENMTEDWIETLPEPAFFPDEVTSEVLRAADLFYRRKLSDVRQVQLIENDFTASWIHEVKAPLTAMKLTIDAHRTDPAMRKIEAEWLRIHLLIDRRLHMARLPSLESDYVLEPATVRRLAVEEVRELTSWCMEKNIAVEFEGEDAEVVTDRKWCRFIIRQLLTNAIKYSPEGGIIRIATGVTENGNAMLVIKDEGPGIPVHDLPRIFDKGFTGGNGRIQNAATGIGLYLAQTVASKIRITLGAQSTPNQGTAVRMIFTAKNDFESVRRGMLI
ncbi:sensor histidine kinase [Aneurinibacillus aneurinilyticus]|jgi:OmpR family two-component system bacitracin resistance sensor histidine kinase BceS|uniref:sensor histidine kinase n=1 Tax=Aneurinibacillus aneurinilyticus TaxID=1391 RepID=UPI00197C1A5A|nr:sensor histidine kinase [Aneurinibacillus aneurinilyticus]MCI1694640.1 sensor histidine kinase [Aneurinibacillus aneurinilyticus]